MTEKVQDTVEEIKKDYLKQLKVNYVKNMSEVIDIALK